MERPKRPINLLVLAGGSSSRMRSPKFLLAHPDGRPSYLHTFETLHRACRSAESGFLCLRNPASNPGLIIESLPGLPISLLYESEIDEIGSQLPPSPLNGLVRAFQHDPASSWLVMPCDYPLMSVDEIKNLLAQHKEPVTCFANGRGHLEPLVAVWDPSALSWLTGMVSEVDQDVNLRAMIHALGGKILQPKYGHSFFNANDPDDWEDAMHLLASST